MLSLLLDENISPRLAKQIELRRHDIPILSVHSWREGCLMAQPDELILVTAVKEGLTLITYDRKTIMPILIQWGEAGIDHAGIVFIDDKTIAPNDFGSLVSSLISLWVQHHEDEWMNTVTYLTMSRKLII